MKLKQMVGTLVLLSLAGVLMYSSLSSTPTVATAEAVAYVADPTANRLPDLVMAPLRDLQVSEEEGERRLRYSFVVVNAAEVPFWITASRSDTKDEMSMTQRVWRADGTHQDQPIDAVAYFAGDEHDHWHTRDLAWARLYRADGSLVIDGHAKHGFCFLDTQRELPDVPNSPAAAVFKGCSEDRMSMGWDAALSPGWGDEYSFDLRDQYIDISALPDGGYRLELTADDDGWFTETSEDNNWTWVDFTLTGDDVKMTAWYRDGVVKPS